MQIIIPRNNFLEEIFPELINYTKLTDEDIAVIKEAYTFGEHQSEINIHDDFIEITIQEDVLQKKKNDFDELIELCEAKKYDNALSLADKLIEQQPAVSEYHRIKGQVLAEQDQPDEAIDALIEAVRLDPENSAALIMLGNIYTRTHTDAETAIAFYERVLETDPDNYFAINNMGGNLAKLDKYNDAKRYFELARDINPDYPNAFYGLALIASRQGQPNQAFELARQTSLKLDKEKHPKLYQQNLSLINKESRKSLRGGYLQELIQPYKQDLEERGQKEIRVEASSNLSTPAKIEIAEVYNRDYHLVKYQPDRTAVAHLVMHELGHLDRQLHARANGKNKLFTSNKHCKEQFYKDNQYIVNNLEKQGFPPGKIQGFVEQIFNGLNAQVYNTPIDLFIEKKIFDDFPELRPYQFVSLMQLEQEYIQSATNKKIQKLIPKKITHVNKILSLVNTIQFRKLYGIDLTDEFKPTKKERDEAGELYSEWLAYFNDDEYAVEYEIIELWAEDLGLTDYFNLVDEESQTNTTLESQVDQIEDDPLALNDDKNVGDEQFSNRDSAAGEMSTVMYIVDALQYFEDKDMNEIQKIGFEIGMLGRSGIDTDSSEQKYSLNSIPGKQFSGRHLLAYMYTAFKKFEPGMDTGIDFDEEYEQAKELYEQGL